MQIWSEKPKVAFITTLNHNIGDDFVREGIRAILDSICDYHAYCIHKHNAEVSCKTREPEDEGPCVGDKILEADLIVNAGAPVYWNLGSLPRYKCSNEDWIEPLWYRRISRVYRSARILNIAAGACQGYHGFAQEIAGDRECARFIRDIHALCQVTVVRDRMAEEVHTLLDLAVWRAPCASIHAWRRFPRRMTVDNRIALNFMSIGGHYEIAGSIDRERWASTFIEIDRLLRSVGFEVVPVAHNVAEREVVRSLLPGREIFHSADYRDYFSFYANCAGGIFNRVHGAMLLAGFGSPAVVIGSDSRARTVDELDLPRYYVNEVEPKQVVKRLCEMVSSEAARNSLLRLESQTFGQISALIRRSIFGSEDGPAYNEASVSVVD